MKFMLMIFGNEQAFAKLSEAEMGKLFAAHGQFSEELGKLGKLVDGAELQPEATAKRIRNTGSKRVITDGPFAETKEVIGGYYLIEADSKEEAIEWGKKCPTLEGEFVEVRALMQR